MVFPVEKKLLVWLPQSSTSVDIHQNRYRTSDADLGAILLVEYIDNLTTEGVRRSDSQKIRHLFNNRRGTYCVLACMRFKNYYIFTLSWTSCRAVGRSKFFSNQPTPHGKGHQQICDFSGWLYVAEAEYHRRQAATALLEECRAFRSCGTTTSVSMRIDCSDGDGDSASDAPRTIGTFP